MHSAWQKKDICQTGIKGFKARIILEVSSRITTQAGEKNYCELSNQN